MTKYNIYAIYDEKSESYNSPFPLATDGLAKRSFEAACQDTRTDLFKYPGDFRLYCLATWDDTQGTFENIVPPRFIAQNSPKVNKITEEIEKLLEDEEESEVI